MSSAANRGKRSICRKEALQKLQMPLKPVNGFENFFQQLILGIPDPSQDGVVKRCAQIPGHHFGFVV